MDGPTKLGYLHFDSPKKVRKNKLEEIWMSWTPRDWKEAK